MLNFLVKRERHLGHQLKSVQVFQEDEHVELGVAADLARIEGLEYQVFIGVDLVDVVSSNKSYFEGAARP